MKLVDGGTLEIRETEADAYHSVEVVGVESKRVEGVGLLGEAVHRAPRRLRDEGAEQLVPYDQHPSVVAVSGRTVVQAVVAGRVEHILQRPRQPPHEIRVNPKHV